MRSSPEGASGKSTVHDGAPGPGSHSDPEERAGNLGRSTSREDRERRKLPAAWPGGVSGAGGGQVASRCGAQRPQKFEAALWGSRAPWTRGDLVCLPAHRPGRVVSPTCAAPRPNTFQFPDGVSSPAGAPGTPALGSHLDESCCHWRALFMLGDRICRPRETCKLLRDKPHWQGLLSLCSDLSFNKLLLSSSCLQSVLLSTAGDKAEARSPFQKASQSIRGSKTYT